MALEESHRRMEARRPPRPPPWNDPRIRAIVFQVLVIGAVLALCVYLVRNTLENMDRQGIATGFGYLDREASFQIGETLIPFSPADTYGRAFLVGLLNTLLVAALGVVLATILGTIAGIARLSSNWLVRKLAQFYVDTLRNVPLLLQLIVWWDVLRVSAPSPRQAWHPLPGVFLSNRGMSLPVPTYSPVYLWMGFAFIVALVLARVLGMWAKRRQMATGQSFPTVMAGLGIIIGGPLLVFLVGGAPLRWSVPALHGFNFRGGYAVTPEFAALLFGLVVYTGTFIAEIVRSGIEAVSRGQSEAAAALGLKRGQALRLIILPQAMRVIIPPMISQYLNLTKNSSLAVAIGYPDLMSISNTTLNQTGQAIEAIAMAMAVYLAISLLTSLFMNWYNRRVTLAER